jgi:DNA ligase (NAD+)
LGVRIGDTVVLQKAGDIIPDIVEILPKLRTGKEKKFRMPAKCPVCGNAVSQPAGEVAYYCTNKECFAQQLERLDHFVSRSAFDIVGLGPKIIEQLQREDLIKSPADIFLLTEEDLRPLERFAPKSAQNLVEAIKKSRTIPLAKFIYALGVRHVGEETAILLAQKIKNYELRIKNINPEELLGMIDGIDLEELQEIREIGGKVAQSIKEWFADKKNRQLIAALSEAEVKIVLPEPAVAEKFAGLSFVLTGELENYSRDEAKGIIRTLGGAVSSSVSKNTNYVLLGENPGSKYGKAKELGVKLISEEEFRKMIKK